MNPELRSTPSVRISLSNRGDSQTKESKFSEEQVIAILRQAAKGEQTVTAVCREHSIAENTFYKWRQKYGGMEVSEARRLRELEKENCPIEATLSRTLHRSRCDERATRKKVLTTAVRRDAVEFLSKQGLSTRRSCQLVQISRCGLHYKSLKDVSDSLLADELKRIASKHLRFGYRRAHAEACDVKVNRSIISALLVCGI